MTRCQEALPRKVETSRPPPAGATSERDGGAHEVSILTAGRAGSAGSVVGPQPRNGWFISTRLGFTSALRWSVHERGRGGEETVHGGYLGEREREEPPGCSL